MSISKKWKQSLLKSSLPLEYSVTEILRDVGLSNPYEFKYERPNEHGRVTTFSIDLYGDKLLNDDRIRANLFIECKYRDPSVNWVFVPESFSSRGAVNFASTFVMLDDLCPSWKINRELVSSFQDRYLACRKGIELTSSGANPKSIEQAIHQLKYAIVKGMTSAVVEQSDDFLGNTNRINILIPIVVTTAKLWRLDPGTTIEEIQAAEKLESVATETDILFSQERPDNELIRFTHGQMDEGVNEQERENLSKTLRENGQLSWDYYSWNLRTSAPSVFVIINYDSVKERLGNLLRFLDQNLLVLARDIPMQK